MTVHTQGDDETPEGETPTGLIRHGQLKRSRPVSSAAKGLGIAAAVLLASTTSVAGIAAWQVLSHEQPSVAFTPAAPSGKAATKPSLSAYAGEVNLLVVASDTRTGQGAGFDDPANQRASSGVGQNDTNLLVHINRSHTSMAVITLPRDLEVPLPSCQNDGGGTTPATDRGMLNTALTRGGENLGLQCVAATVASLTGVQIDYAAMIKFDGVVKMSTAIGGVTVCLATPLVDPNTDPPLDIPTTGPHTFVGAEAGAFLRTREGVGQGGDTARISNQQVFMSALMRQIVDGGVLDNPVKLYGLATAALSNVRKSASLDVGTLVKIGAAVKGIGLDNIVFLQYPSLPDPTNTNRLIPDPNGVSVLKSALVSNQAIALSQNSLGQSAKLDGPPATSAAPQAPASSAAPAPHSSSASPPKPAASSLDGRPPGLGHRPERRPEDLLGQGVEADDVLAQLLLPVPLETRVGVVDAANELLFAVDNAGEALGTMQLTRIPGIARRGSTRLLVEAVRVRSDIRSAGIGGAMMRWVTDVAAPELDSSLVQLTSDAARTDAHRFYERLGFVASHVGFKYQTR